MSNNNLQALLSSLKSRNIDKADIIKAVNDVYKPQNSKENTNEKSS